jgi:aryl-phospho-beta-D-glucosidase BglC (GH1 family)/20S proteasome alpha/beta subunit
MAGFSLFGVNLSGAEYNPGGTRGVNFDYTYPTDAEIDYFAAQGMTAIRLPFLLERLEPVAGGPLDPTQLGYIDNVVNYAATKGIDVILDPHDYGYEYGTLIGSTPASNATFANFWGEVAAHYASTSNVLFGLMNEPNAQTPSQWIVSVNAAIAAIRAAGATSQQILVPGTDWDGADSWVSSGNAQIVGDGVVDPSHNYAFEVHQYLDSDGSGTHSTVVSASIGVERLEAITEWAEATGNKLFLGEFGVASDPTSLAALNNMLGYMAQNTDVWEGGTYWAAGAWLGSYMYSAQPTNGVGTPQLAVLDQYVPTTIQTDGSTSLTEFANSYFLDSGGAGPSLKGLGVNVVASQSGGWAPIGAEQTASGYEVAWKLAGADEYTVWTTDSNGNFISNIGVVSGTSAALESLEPSFHQDLNGDGVIGLVGTTIQTDGSTSLTEFANSYFLDTGGSGPSLKGLGVNVVASQIGGWAPIGAEQTESGYEVAWKLAGADEYTVWTTDSNGNFISNIGVVSGTSGALESLEPSFHQDLNGDGVIGLVGTTIEADGSTTLMEVGSSFYLDTGGSGPSLKSFGANVVPSQIGGWAPIGAEQTTSGYEVAWKLAGADQYTVWTTDSNGNFISNIGVVSGTSAALESLESSFHQDLNGDGVIGVVTTVIESNGSTSLVEVANNFALYNGGGSGPLLKGGGVAVVAGQSGGWAPIGAEQTTGGYEVAWKLAGADEYTVWTTDSNGNFISNIGVVSGTSSALEALEPSFHQDLNGDGVIGLAVAAGATLELNSAHSDAVTFISSTGMLQLDTPSTFTGQIIGFTGNGTLSGSDKIDLLNMAYSSSIQTDSTYGSSTGSLTVSNGTTVDLLDFVGSYSLANFKFASDGHGGTIVYDPPATKIAGNSTVSLAAGAGQDNFVFAPNFGQVTLSNFKPGTDTLQVDHTMFAGMNALLAAMHDDVHGNAVITDAAHDSITIVNVTTAQLLAHQGGFHLV